MYKQILSSIKKYTSNLGAGFSTSITKLKGMRGGNPMMAQQQQASVGGASWFSGRSLLGMVALILAVAAILYAVKQWTKPSTYNANKEHGSGTNLHSDTTNIILIYTDWCPACKRAKPEWETVKAQYDRTVVNGRTIMMTEYNGDTEQAIMDKYGVKGFPTIKMVKDDGQVVDFDAAVTEDNLIEFINSS